MVFVTQKVFDSERIIYVMNANIMKTQIFHKINLTSKVTPIIWRDMFGVFFLLLDLLI